MLQNQKGKIKKVDKHKEDKYVDVLTSKKKRKVKEIASTSNKQDKSVEVLISKKKRKVKDIASQLIKKMTNLIQLNNYILKELR